MDSGVSKVTLMDVTMIHVSEASGSALFNSARESRSTPALIPKLPDTLVSSEILVKLVDDLGPSHFFQLRLLNSGWRDVVSHFRQWDAFQAQKAELGYDLYVVRASRLHAYLLELRKSLGQPPPTTEMGPVTYYTFVCGLERGDIGELEFIEAFKLAAAGKLEEEEERDDQSYWWEDDVDMSTNKDGA